MNEKYCRSLGSMSARELEQLVVRLRVERVV
jgi:hypothetical protein